MLMRSPEEHSATDACFPHPLAYPSDVPSRPVILRGLKKQHSDSSTAPSPPRPALLLQRSKPAFFTQPPTQPTRHVLHRCKWTPHVPLSLQKSVRPLSIVRPPLPPLQHALMVAKQRTTSLPHSTSFSNNPTITQPRTTLWLPGKRNRPEATPSCWKTIQVSVIKANGVDLKRN